MILKVLLVVAVIGIVYFMFIKKKPLKSTNSNKKHPKERVESNDMVECSTCGVYCELDESILSSGKYYCSDECLDNPK